MKTAEDVFARHFPGLSPDEVDAELSRRPVAGATPISAVAGGFLAEYGGVEAHVAIESYDEADVQRDRTLTAAKTLQDLLASSWSLEIAAERLGISRSRLCHQIGSKTLYAFTVQRRRYVPQWQFVTASARDRAPEPIPGLSRIVPLIPHDLHPLAVRAFMETPLGEFDGRSPVAFLISQGPVEIIVEFLGALGRW